MSNTRKNIILRIFIYIICYLISQEVCYFFIDDILVNFTIAIQSFILLRALIASILYISLNLILRRDIYNFEKDVLFIIYILLVISTSIFRFELGADNDNLVNFNIINMINYSRTTILVNIVVYIPFGYYIEKRLNLKFLFAFLIFLFYILTIEILQKYMRVGFFDFNDIVLNYISFFIGYITVKIKNKYKVLRHKI